MDSNLKLCKKDTDDIFAIQCIELDNDLGQKVLMKMNGIISFIKKIIKR